MASDTESSRRKHRRSSSDDEAEKSSKRHKHRHHHRHHRRRSKRHGEEDGEQSRDEIATPQRPDSPPPPAVSVGNSSRIVDYDDVEEGEILEEEVSGGAGIKSVELGEQKSDSGNLGVHGHNSDNGFMKNSPVRDKVESEFTLPRDSRTLDENELLSRAEPEADANGHLGHVYHKEDRKRHNKYGSPKRKIYDDVDAADGDEGKSSDWKKSSSSASRGDRQMIVVRSPSHERHHDGVRTRMRSMSHDISRDRSPPHSVEEDGAHMKHRQHLEIAQNDSDEERMSRHRRDVRHDGRGKERERSASYSRYLGGEDGDHDWDTRDSWEREMDRERRREKELERRRDREMERERRKEKEWDRKHESDTDRHIREKERERSLDWEVEKDRRREMEWGRSGDRDRERKRESEWCRSRDRELDVEWRNEKERGSSRDREEDLYRKRRREREMSRDEDRSRLSTRERDRDRQREKERDRHRDRDMDRDRVRDHDWESERDRERRSDRNSNVGKVIKRDSLKVSRADSDAFEVDRDKLDRDVDEQHDFEERIALKLAEQEEDDDVNRIKEESRKRRQAILEKYKNQQSQQHSVPQPEDVGKVHEEPAEQPTLSLSAANITAYDTRTDGVDVDLTETLISVEKSPQENGAQAATSERASGAAGLGEGTPKSERSDGKYCDDIFGETPAGVRKLGKGEGLTITRSGLHDNWDDAEGYYSYRFGEILDSRYEIAAAHGKGVFSTVVRAKDLKSSNGEPEEVAIKIIRNNETMHKAGQVEVQILQKLAGADPENRRHCVRFLSSFKYRNHLCLVFESLHMNLREVLKRFGRNIGLKLTAVRTYAKQLFIALKHLKNCGVLHCDIKPDNMLVNEAKNVLKLCDFGNAMFSGKNEITPYLVSRFYRAPEIILGLPYDHPMDMWSVGCCLYELYTGKVLFPGPTNNDMLRLHMELKGPFPKKMLKKGAFVDQHFDQDLNFHATEEDPVTKKIIKRMIVNIKPKDIGSIVKGSSGEDLKMLANFKDLLDKIFVLDPDKRMTVSQALAHPFITGK